MSFMEPQITQYIEWITYYDLLEHCEASVPAEHWDEDMGPIELMHKGYGARLSAPGHMDCTDWTVFDTEEKAREYLCETFDLCDLCMSELDENYECPLNHTQKQ